MDMPRYLTQALILILRIMFKGEDPFGFNSQFSEHWLPKKSWYNEDLLKARQQTNSQFWDVCKISGDWIYTTHAKGFDIKVDFTSGISQWSINSLHSDNDWDTIYGLIIPKTWTILINWQVYRELWWGAFSMWILIQVMRKWYTIPAYSTWYSANYYSGQPQVMSFSFVDIFEAWDVVFFSGGAGAINTPLKFKALLHIL